MVKKKQLVCVGKVSDEYGVFYIMRNSEVAKNKIVNKNTKDYTGKSINVPKTLVFFGNFIVNNQIYFYLKEQEKKE